LGDTDWGKKSMLKQEAKRQIVKDWLALPPSERETPNQALLFVTKWRQRHGWRTSNDPGLRGPYRPPLSASAGGHRVDGEV